MTIENEITENVLVVDDNKINRFILTNMIKNYGNYLISEAANGLEAVEKVQHIMTESPSKVLIFMDLEVSKK